MSSEYTIHPEDLPIKGRVSTIGFSPYIAAVRLQVGGVELVLYPIKDRWEDMAQVFRKLAQSLAPAPSTAHCPGTGDGSDCPCFQAGERHGYEAERRPIGA